MGCRFTFFKENRIYQASCKRLNLFKVWLTACLCKPQRLSVCFLDTKQPKGTERTERNSNCRYWLLRMLLCTSIIKQERLITAIRLYEWLIYCWLSASWGSPLIWLVFLPSESACPWWKSNIFKSYGEQSEQHTGDLLYMSGLVLCVTNTVMSLRGCMFRAHVCIRRTDTSIAWRTSTVCFHVLD